MLPITFDVNESVAIITLNSGENRFNPAFIQAFLSILDQVENQTDAVTAVIKTAHDRIFSNGLDFEWFFPVVKKRDETAFKAFFYQLNTLFKRLVTYPLITVSAIGGHAFALGAIICCAFDFRFMQTGRGYFCLPAIDLGLPFLPGMLSVLRKAIPPYKLEEMILTGVRLTAEECETHHIIRKAYPADLLLSEALAYAKSLRKKREIVAEMKTRWNKAILHAIDVEDIPYIEAGMADISIPDGF